VTDPDRLLSEFIDAWVSGAMPDAQDYIERAPVAARDRLADDIATYLALAPTPDYSSDVVEALMRDRTVVELAQAIESERGLWPDLLLRLRRQAGLDPGELAAVLVARLGLEGSEEKTERYLERMEQGRLDPRGVSQRVLDALGPILGVGGEVLAGAGDFQMFAEPAFSGAVLHGESAEPVRDDGLDEVDRLFCGGRDQPGPDADL